MLLSGKPLSNSTQASLNKSNIKPIPKKKDNFFVFVCKQSWNLIMGLWMRFRKFMWIGSTGNHLVYHRFYHHGHPLCICLHAGNAKRNYETQRSYFFFVILVQNGNRVI